MPNRDHTTVADAFRPNRLPASTRRGKPRAIPRDFRSIVNDHRRCGRTDDDIALSFGITTEALHTRFRRFGIPAGRRWRDIEDAQAVAPLSRDTIRGYNTRRAS